MANSLDIRAIVITAHCTTQAPVSYELASMIDVWQFKHFVSVAEGLHKCANVVVVVVFFVDNLRRTLRRKKRMHNPVT